MFNHTNNRITSGRRGQTLVIAIMVMFILAVISAVFIALVARNLFRSERFSNVDAVAQLAEAGVRYADKMLTSSEDGADWRPKPDNNGVTNVPTYPDVLPVSVPADELAIQKQYPDFKWTRAWWPTEYGNGCAGPTGGYTTFRSGGGRFLLRVSYNPTPRDPLSKYIKIESIGRWGVFDEDDPTTWANEANTGMRREITAYKPIGVTDYLRFITNKDHRSTNFTLGCPGYHSIFGRSPDSNYGSRGGPIRVNGNLMFCGKSGSDSGVEIFLRSVASGTTSSTSGTIPLDWVEVSGEIKQYKDDDGSVGVIVDVIEPNESTVTQYSGRPSSDTSSTDWTIDGFWRDGSSSSTEPARRIKYLDPPLPFEDNSDTTGTTTRYRLLTLNSGARKYVNGSWVNLGEYGWGRGIYIDNSNDVQSDSATLFGGYTLRSDWLQPGNKMSKYWKGPFYIPPGVVIVLNPNDTDGDRQADMTITRTDGSVWHDPDGKARPDWGKTVTVPYPDAADGRTLHWKSEGGDSSYERTIDGNGVIYAEGNIRIRGMLPADTQLTVVSNSNIYIEGNILKYRNPSTTISSDNPWRGTGTDTESCGIALLARQNVCVNTTQFMSPIGGVGDNIDDDDSVVVSSNMSSRLRMSFGFAPYESDKGSDPNDHMLLLRHSGQFGTSYINAWLNARQSLTNWGILYLNNDWSLGPSTHSPVSTLPVHIWGIGDPNFNPSGWGIDSSYFGEAFHLTSGTDSGGLNAELYTKPGAVNSLMLALDQTSYTYRNYLLGGLAIQPMDIRIEAVIYAQDGSFFVIPGRWFNQNPSDTEADYSSSTGRQGARDAFPFYGQPLDIRVIIDGAVSENMPAVVSDVTEWMSKWGTIPDEYGSTGLATAHPGEGLTILYDDHAAWPYKSLRPWTTTSSTSPIRRDSYGRTLPIAPRLPVCGSLIYFGDVM
ncbi:hypothetical protein LLG46_04045 [bacterium]|nr:hypothetical protein [bacterium]